MSVELFIVYRPDEVIVVNTEALFFNLESNLSWGENSPLPPGLRYFELDDMRHKIFTQFGDPFQPGIGVDDLIYPNLTNILQLGSNPESILLPKDSQGNIRTNLKPLPADAWYRLPDYYADFTYWTGEVLDPLNWQDDYWDGLDRGGVPRVDRAGMAAYLEEHPAARFG
jgi:hypothetical protein